MKKKNNLRYAVSITYILSVLALFLPWFSYNPQLTGYRCGYLFILWFLVPMIILGFIAFKKTCSKVLIILGEIAIIANLTSFVIIFGKWQEYCNIKVGFHWYDGFKTALPTFWITTTIFIIFTVLYQLTFFLKHKNNN